MLLLCTDTGGNVIMKPIVRTASPCSIMRGFINIMCPHYYCTWSCMTFHKCIQSYSAWGVGCGMKQDNLAFGEASLGFASIFKHSSRQRWRHSKIQGQGQTQRSVYLLLCICECEKEHERVMVFVLWQYSALVGITLEQIPNRTTCIFTSRWPKSHNSQWPLVETVPLPTVAQSLSSNAHLFFVRLWLLHLVSITIRVWHLKRMITLNFYLANKGDIIWYTLRGLWDRNGTGLSIWIWNTLNGSNKLQLFFPLNPMGVW